MWQGPCTLAYSQNTQLLSHCVTWDGSVFFWEICLSHWPRRFKRWPARWWKVSTQRNIIWKTFFFVQSAKSKEIFVIWNSKSDIRQSKQLQQIDIARSRIYVRKLTLELPIESICLANICQGSFLMQKLQLFVFLKNVFCKLRDSVCAPLEQIKYFNTKWLDILKRT